MIALGWLFLIVPTSVLVGACLLAVLIAVVMMRENNW